MSHDPIAALSSGQGSAAVAIIRVSGEGCHPLLMRVLKGPRMQERMLHLMRVVKPDGTVIDDVMAVKFVGSKSFTGEDSAEIHCHGGPYIVQQILTLLYKHGMRPARPGEFTERAFINGKLDLTEAEGIKELVHAQSHQQWLAARQLATGSLSAAIDGLRETLLGALAYLEAQIDFPDEGDVGGLTLNDVQSRVRQVEQQIQGLLRTYQSGRVASEGLRIAIFGEPNAGKSTLMNTLLGKERAIVTAIAGTTRDYLEESCLLEGRLVRLIDLAGIRESSDPIEAIGVSKARELAKAADLVLILASVDQFSNAHDVKITEAVVSGWLDELKPQSYVKVMTKLDTVTHPHTVQGWLPISCHSGQGLQQFYQELKTRVDHHVSSVANEPAFVTTARQAQALESALAHCQAFYQSCQTTPESVELHAFELYHCAKSLQSIVGEVTNDEILGKVFSDFCIGK